MKIVFISSRSLDNIGGIETYMKNLCPRLVKLGHEVIIYTEGIENGKSTFAGVQIISFKSVRNKFLNKIFVGWKSTLHALKKHRSADIFHYNAMAAGLSSFLPILLHKTVVFQGHGFEWKRAKWSNFNRQIIKLLDDFVLKINRNITMVSEEQSNYVKKRFKKKSITITPGINLPTKVIVNERILKKQNINKGKYFLYLGRLVPEKKAEILIIAFLQSGIKDKQLIIAGDDPNEIKYITQLKKIAKKSDNIIFTGGVYGNEKELLLQECYAFCIPSELEGLPITLLEAMSYKKVCIVSDISANIEALGDTGLLFKKNNIIELSNVLNYCNKLSSLEKEKIGYESFNRVKKNFTWEKIVNDFNNYYSNLQ